MSRNNIFLALYITTLLAAMAFFYYQDRERQAKRTKKNWQALQRKVEVLEKNQTKIILEYEKDTALHSRIDTTGYLWFEWPK